MAPTPRREILKALRQKALTFVTEVKELMGLGKRGLLSLGRTASEPAKSSGLLSLALPETRFRMLPTGKALECLSASPLSTVPTPTLLSTPRELVRQATKMQSQDIRAGRLTTWNTDMLGWSQQASWRVGGSQEKRGIWPNDEKRTAEKGSGPEKPRQRGRSQGRMKEKNHTRTKRTSEPT